MPSCNRLNAFDLFHGARAAPTKPAETASPTPPASAEKINKDLSSASPLAKQVRITPDSINMVMGNKLTADLLVYI
ncbi:hypothetical protein GGF32_009657 [Allomyces javanicus]|nr:hypothetical protein GGF32_009657 [Allomyces javanicus]